MKDEIFVIKTFHLFPSNIETKLNPLLIYRLWANDSNIQSLLWRMEMSLVSKV